MRNLVRIKMLGKDSVPYDQTIEVDGDVYNQLQKFISKKESSDKIFDKVSYIDISNYFKTLDKKCTPKLLRTVKCNEILIKELKSKKIKPEDSVVVKLRAMFESNLEIAKTLNHQKNIGKNQKEQESKQKDRVAKAKARIKEIKKRGAEKLAKLQDELDACRKLWTGDKLKAKKAAIKERKEKLEHQIERAVLAASNAELALDKKKLTKDINLGTSLASYADPRIIYSWCKTFDVPIEKIYTPAARKNFDWAADCDKDYWKRYPNV